MIGSNSLTLLENPKKRPALPLQLRVEGSNCSFFLPMFMFRTFLTADEQKVWRQQWRLSPLCCSALTRAWRPDISGHKVLQHSHRLWYIQQRPLRPGFRKKTGNEEVILMQKNISLKKTSLVQMCRSVWLLTFLLLGHLERARSMRVPPLSLGLVRFAEHFLKRDTPTPAGISTHQCLKLHLGLHC